MNERSVIAVLDDDSDKRQQIQIFLWEKLQISSYISACLDFNFGDSADNHFISQLFDCIRHRSTSPTLSVCLEVSMLWLCPRLVSRLPVSLLNALLLECGWPSSVVLPEIELAGIALGRSVLTTSPQRCLTSAAIRTHRILVALNSLIKVDLLLII